HLLNFVVQVVVVQGMLAPHPAEARTSRRQRHPAPDSPRGARVPPTTASLDELVATLNDGVAFYERAAGKVTDPGLADLFGRMARLKQAIAGDLNAEIALLG